MRHHWKQRYEYYTPLTPLSSTFFKSYMFCHPDLSFFFPSLTLTCHNSPSHHHPLPAKAASKSLHLLPFLWNIYDSWCLNQEVASAFPVIMVKRPGRWLFPSLSHVLVYPHTHASSVTHVHKNENWWDRQKDNRNLIMLKENTWIGKKSPEAFWASYLFFRLYHKISIIINFSCGCMAGQAASPAFVFKAFIEKCKKLLYVW